MRKRVTSGRHDGIVRKQREQRKNNARKDNRKEKMGETKRNRKRKKRNGKEERQQFTERVKEGKVAERGMGAGGWKLERDEEDTVGVRGRRKHSVHVNVLQAKNFIGALRRFAFSCHASRASGECTRCCKL